MLISDVSNDDGIAMAHVLSALKVARYDGVTGEDLEKFFRAKRWLSNLANQMAEQLKSKTSQPVPESSGFKIKAMGSLPTSNSKKLNKKKK